MDNNRRLEIARRNQRKSLESRDYKAMMLILGVQGYSAVANIVASIAYGMGGSMSIGNTVFGALLGGLYALAAYITWFKNGRPVWMIVLPSATAILQCALLFVSGGLPIIPLLLNVAALIAILVRVKAQNELTAMSAVMPNQL